MAPSLAALKPARRLRVKTGGFALKLVSPCAPAMARPFAGLKPTRRLRVKTGGLTPKQRPLLIVDDWAADEVDGARRRVYLATFPHPRAAHSKDGFRLLAPGGVLFTSVRRKKARP